MLKKRRQSIRQAVERPQRNTERARRRAEESKTSGSSTEQAISGTTDGQGVSSSLSEATGPVHSEESALREEVELAGNTETMLKVRRRKQQQDTVSQRRADLIATSTVRDSGR